jgi:LacI family transcriptional regulator
MKKLTLEEVAKLAGVSRATVSRVVNNPERVSLKYRERVLKVIKETGYQPNQAARILASQRSNIIGLIISSRADLIFTDPYFAVLITGISRACNAHNYTLALFVFHTQEEQEQVYQRALGTGLLDGLIVTADKITDPLIPQIAAREIPAVYVGRPFDKTNTSFVNVDNVAGAYMAASHLVRLGYQRIATITGPMSSTTSIDRHEGYIKALTERAHAVEDDLIVCGDFTRDSGYTAMRQLLPHKPDAVFVATDTMALGAIQAIHEANLTIPGDIAIVGFDDLPSAIIADPPLTTIRQPVNQNGRLAVEMLIDLLETGPDPPHHTILPTELIIRATCGAIKFNSGNYLS